MKSSVPFRAAVAAVVLLAAVALAIDGCGKDEETETTRTLRIYVSQPLKGDRGGEDMLRAVEIANEDEGGTIGPARIEIVGMNDSDESGNWVASLVRRNARRAAADDSAVAYIGDFDSGATEVAMPILNRAGMLQVSSSATAVKLTKPLPELGEHIRPTGIRTFGRVVPNDNVQAAALALFMDQESVNEVFVVDDGDTYGEGLRFRFEKVARHTGIEITGGATVTRSIQIGDVAKRVIGSGADALLFAGSNLDLARDLFETVHREDNFIKLFGGDGLSLSSFLGSLGDTGLDTYITAPQLPAGNYARSGESFLRGFQERYGRPAEPMAVFAYEAGHVVIDSIRKGTRGDIATEPIDALRQNTRNAFFDTSERASPLGSYSIDTNGDTTLTFYGAYRVEDGQLVLGRTIDVPPSLLREDE
ncbi:MAG TPA: branched-chain amino acid ABC transporter substrate-binding protein [Solirubrobacterales bacterium]|nr:branched-chain amino acid ABC transporter substrate-binding protein [Solirubrobacterales bacterium]HNI40683.1 branched-chain amino acid ABC transporter substrate-binding protein [Solirubrobacterales bacterium]HNK66654.1 branched-chain amino acid ABC transporter substrate-binding protein [Solirubrobacterales bacterium]